MPIFFKSDRLTRLLFAIIEFATFALAIGIVLMLLVPPAHADDITVEQPFHAELARQHQPVDAAKLPHDEEELLNRQPPHPNGNLTQAQSEAQFKAERAKVHELDSEDSGSSYLKQHHD